MRTRLFALALLLAGTAHAHKPSDSYLSIRADGQSISGQWDIALRDLEHAIGLDADGDGAITWGELKARHAELEAYALARLALRADDKPCRLAATERLVDEHSDGAYAVLRFAAHCEPARYRALTLEYSLFFDLDPTHRGLLRSEAGGQTRTAVLSPERPRVEVGADARSALEQFGDYLREGIWHIWIGFDHILFLVSLLLPSVFIYFDRQWQPAERFRDSFWDVFKVATSFTVAHSITLSLAALSVIDLPSRLVESAIALSVVLAALNNVWPVVHGRRWLAAFGFGLVHGFGFASVLRDAGLPNRALGVSLFSFNLGVEVGQALIVAVVATALAYVRRSSEVAARYIVIAGSVVVMLAGVYWFIERVF
jgi:hypothetical protein